MEAGDTGMLILNRKPKKSHLNVRVAEEFCNNFKIAGIGVNLLLAQGLHYWYIRLIVKNQIMKYVKLLLVAVVTMFTVGSAVAQPMHHHWRHHPRRHHHHYHH
jgi:hypothetical protein